MKIILIEDDIYLNTLICDVLMSQGYEVDAFADGAKALKAIETEYEPSEERDLILNFIKSSERGIVRGSIDD